MKENKKFAICPNCGAKNEMREGRDRNYCPDCGEDMTVRLNARQEGSEEFDYERGDILEFYEREDWE